MGLIGAADGDTSVNAALKRASRQTDAGFDYLFKTAMRESSMNPEAKARTSSAAGLFQFIESTWLETVKETGSEHGLDKYASQIKKTDDGKYVVPDRAARREILALRFDPATASVMAGEFTERNEARLEGRLGRNVNDAELYMAHFMGSKGAGRLIELSQSSPDARADRMFPKEARANKPIFYESGRARTISEVYDALAAKHGREPVAPAQVQTARNAETNGNGREDAPIADQPFLNRLGFFRKRGDDAVAMHSTGRPVFHGMYSDAGPKGSDPAMGFWNAQSPERASDAPTVLKSAVKLNPETPMPIPRPASSHLASAIVSDAPEMLTNWLGATDADSPSRPLDLAEMASLYRRHAARSA